MTTSEINNTQTINQIINNCCMAIHSYYSYPYFHFLCLDSLFNELFQSIDTNSNFFKTSQRGYRNLLNSIHRLETLTPLLKKSRRIQRVFLHGISYHLAVYSRECFLESLVQISHDILSDDQKLELVKDLDIESSLKEWEQKRNSADDRTASKRILDAFYNDAAYLSLSELHLTSLPVAIKNLNHLKKLNLTGLGLDNIPDFLFDLFDLETLSLDRNKLTILPDFFAKLKMLKSLSLSDNSLHTLPPSFWELSNLEELNLDKNKVEILSSKVGKLSRLKVLSLKNNNLESLPDEIGTLSNLVQLHLRNNNLSSLPETITNLKKLTSLNFYNNYIVYLPPGLVDELISLEILTCARNCLESLPETTRPHPHLKKLFCSINRLESLSPSIGNLQQLKQLDLSDNHLETLPERIGNLHQLIELDCMNNHLLFLPSTLGNISTLKEINLKNNPNLTELPLSLGTIPSLTRIRTQFSSIPLAMVIAILVQTNLLRINSSRNTLMSHLTLWESYARREDSRRFDLAFIASFSQEEKRTIMKWLSDLALTRDFRSNQQELASIACCFLESLKENQKFKTFFFDYLETNFGHCQDRTSMVFNVLYTQWKLDTIDPQTPLEEKLGLLEGIAKTLTLRHTLEDLMEGMENIEESVETFLYCETQLRERLGLITAIKKMAYSTIGNRDWVDLDAHARSVERNYLKTMVSLPATHELASLWSGYRKIKDEVIEKHTHVSESLENIKLHLTSIVYLELTNLIKKSCEDQLDFLTTRWVEDHRKNIGPIKDPIFSLKKKREAVRSADMQNEADTFYSHRILKQEIEKKFQQFSQELASIKDLCEKEDFNSLMSFLPVSKELELTNLTLDWAENQNDSPF